MKFLLATTLLVGVFIQVQGSPADARIREQFDQEHEEGIDRIRARIHSVHAAEAGNKDRQLMAQDSEAEVLVANVKPGRGGRGGARRQPEVGDRLVDRQGDQRGAEQRQMGDSEGQADQGQDGMGRGDGMGEGADAQRGGDQRNGDRIPIVYARGSDRKVYDRQHDDVAKYAKQDDIDFAKDSYRKKDKTSHKKEEIYTTRK